MKVKKKNQMLYIELPVIDPPRESKSGKTLLVASSNGPRRTSFIVNGQHAVAIVNVYVRPQDYVKSVGKRRRNKLVRNPRADEKGRRVKRAVHVNRRSS